MINKMVARNLLHRPIRTSLSILAVAVEVTMILMIVGLGEGLLEDSQRRTRGVGADILIRPSTSSAAMNLSTADIPEKLAAKLVEEFPEIEVATGTTVMMQGDLQTITGVDWDRFLQMADGIRYFGGGPMEKPYDAIVDEVYSRHKKVRVGDTIGLLNHDFHVKGIVESGKMSRVFIPLSTMQDLMGWRGKVSQVYLKLRDPKQTYPVIDRIKQLLPSYPVYAMEDLLTKAAADVREMSAQVVNVIIGIAVIIGFIVVLLSMYTAILERTREIGILKSLGASKSYITRLILREALVVCSLGILAGFGLSVLAKWVVEAQFPLVSIVIPANWLVGGAIIAAAGSLLGAFYPAAKAARQDPVSALAYD